MIIKSIIIESMIVFIISTCCPSMDSCDAIMFCYCLTNKTDHHDITEILLKVVLNTINLNLLTV
jgi:hypothetical protein